MAGPAGAPVERVEPVPRLGETRANVLTVTVGGELAMKATGLKPAGAYGTPVPRLVEHHRAVVAGADDAGGTGQVVDHDVLPELSAQTRCELAGEEGRAAAGWAGHPPAHRPPGMGRLGRAIG